MNLMSDTLFHAVAMHNKAAVELIIRIVLRRKDIVAGMG